MNPWVILAIVLAFGASNAGSYMYGQHVEAGDQAQAREQAVTDAITAHNETAADDMVTAYEVGLEKGRARVAADQNRQEFSHAIATVPRSVSCDINPAAFSLLLAAVDGANTDPPPAERLPQPLPGAAKAGKPPGG